MIVLGLNCGHGAAAALVVDGKVLAAIEEEKLNRVKGYVGFPFAAMDHVLAAGNVDRGDVDRVALGMENVAEFSYCFIHLVRQVFQRGGYWTAKARVLDLYKYLCHRWDSSALLEAHFYRLFERATGITRDKVVKVNHHLAHAASAFYTCPWPEALIITADGKGDGLCGGAYMGSGEGVWPLDAVSDRYSVGQLYQAVTKFLGYRVNRHEGKIMGLAAYGRAEETAEILRELIGVDDDDRMYNRCDDRQELARDPVAFYEQDVEPRDYISARYVRYLNGDLRRHAIVHQLYQNFLREKVGGCGPEDLAAGVQRLTETVLLSYVQRFAHLCPEGRLCLAGGVFANVRVNQLVGESASVNHIYVQPAMDDAGCALGAALQVAADAGEIGQQPAWETVYQGPGYTEQDMAASLAAADCPFRKSDVFAEDVALRLHQGKIVGRFAGKLEWGPRALGNRSILASPTERVINETLNHRLQRTEFMPFAPAILAERADDYLLGYDRDDLAARYMTVTYGIEPDKAYAIPAVVHVDGTARPQVVFEEEQPDFHRIISAYGRLSGIPVVVNTSFNMHEEPIVATPGDAIRAFKEGAVDCLSMGPFIVDA